MVAWRSRIGDYGQPCGPGQVASEHTLRFQQLLVPSSTTFGPPVGPNSFAMNRLSSELASTRMAVFTTRETCCA